jgi:hypothetical protein
MATNPLGSGVSRYITDKDRQYTSVVFQASKPPLDSELNLISLIDLENQAEEVRSRLPSGWLMNEMNPRADYSTDPSYSNYFFFGRNQSGEVRNLTWAVVNGWMVPVTGTRTGSPPINPNDVDYWNRIILNPPPTGASGNVPEFIFLEVWLQRIDVDPPPPAVAPGKPTRNFIYRFGNVDGGFSYLPDELVDPDINYETTKRVQLQYRIRNVQNIGLSTNPEGFDPTTVFAQGALSVPTNVPFTNMRQALGDPGLWRAGTGDPVTFGTADGYVYAIPLCVVWRRNSAGFSTSNLAGAFNRNSTAISKLDYTTYANQITLPAAISDTDTTFTLNSISGTFLSKMSNFGEAYVRIDDEYVRISSVTTVSPTSFIVNITDRGVLGSTARSHVAGSAVKLYTIRPDGLFADQVTSTDILDLRHSVADKFDYESILKTNVVELLKGNLRSTWKTYGAAASQGAVVLYGDIVTNNPTNAGLTKLDAPDGLRRTWSDSAVMQRFCIPIRCPNPADPNPVTSPTDLAGNFKIAPYESVINWSGFAPAHPNGPSRNNASGIRYWWNGDEVTVKLQPFQSVLGSDADQVRFVLPDELSESILVRFEGGTSDPNGGIPVNPNTTSPTASNPQITISGKRILKPNDGLVVTLDGSDLKIKFLSGAVDSPLNEWADALQGNNDAYATNVAAWIEFTVIYGAGRGLSHKPEWIHSVVYDGNPVQTSKALLRQGLSNTNPMVPTYLSDSPYIQTGNNRTYARTSDVMLDPGSKSLYIAPYTYQTIPTLTARSGDTSNWYYTTPSATVPLYQGLMPINDQNGNPISGMSAANRDALNLFKKGNVGSVYVEIPLEFLPKPGFHHVPIYPMSATPTAYYSSGINFMLSAFQGVVGDNALYNPNIVAYPDRPGYYIATPQAGEIYGTKPGTSAYTVFGQKASINAVSSATGTVFTGIRFPKFYGPARITGVYERISGAYEPTNSPFNSDREFVGGTSPNCLRDSFDGPTFLLEVDKNGDLTFVLNSEVIDLTKATPGATFEDREWLIECVLFGFDRGFLQTNGRFVVVNPSVVNSTTRVANQQTSNADSKIGIISPAPLAVLGTNNQVTVFYSRAPYQGNPFGTQYGQTDDIYRLGPLTPSQSYSIFNNPLGPVDTLQLPAKNGYEILTAISFTTDLGTGRLSGSNPIPLLNTFEAPANPPDYAGTRVDLYRRFSLNRVGYEDWEDIKFPVDPATIIERPEIKTYALSEVFDSDIHPELAGSITQLPLGVYFRDKDFIGKTLYQTRSASGNASIPVGTFSVTPYEAPTTPSSVGLSTWEGREFVCGNSSNTSGVGSEALVKVDGIDTRNGSGAYTSTTIFKTTRGGAAYSATGPWPGGNLSSRFPKARPNNTAGSVLTATAYLVRSQPETYAGREVHVGNELQMVIVTQAAPSYFRDSEINHSAAGTNEGYTAVDRYRLLGKPLEKRRGTVDTNVLPANQPLFVNKIYDNPAFYGSSDLPLISLKQETVAVTANDQTVFSLSTRPLDPTTVQMFVNGVKLQYGATADFVVGGATNQTVTYFPNPPVHPPLVTTDVVEFWYVIF